MASADVIANSARRRIELSDAGTPPRIDATAVPQTLRTARMPSGHANACRQRAHRKSGWVRATVGRLKTTRASRSMPVRQMQPDRAVGFTGELIDLERQLRHVVLGVLRIHDQPDITEVDRAAMLLEKDWQ